VKIALSSNPTARFEDLVRRLDPDEVADIFGFFTSSAWRRVVLGI